MIKTSKLCGVTICCILFSSSPFCGRELRVHNDEEKQHCIHRTSQNKELIQSLLSRELSISPVRWTLEIAPAKMSALTGWLEFIECKKKTPSWETFLSMQWFHYLGEVDTSSHSQSRSYFQLTTIHKEKARFFKSLRISKPHLSAGPMPAVDGQDKTNSKVVLEICCLILLCLHFLFNFADLFLVYYGLVLCVFMGLCVCMCVCFCAYKFMPFSCSLLDFCSFIHFVLFLSFLFACLFS